MQRIGTVIRLYMVLLVLCFSYIAWGVYILGDYRERQVALKDKLTVTEPSQKEVVPIVNSNPRPVNVIHTSSSLKNSIQYQLMHNNQWVSQYNCEQPIIMNKAAEYSSLAGVTCFRGNNYRGSPSYGKARIEEEKLEYLWDISIGGIDSWTGVGWNGQPAIVKWDEQWKEKMNLVKTKKQKKDLKEVIYAALDGKVYFLDLDNGEETRPSIKIPGPVKGSVTVDPRGLPLLYVGQGINKVHGQTVEMGYRIFSLINQEKLFFINGYDPFALRSWGAFDSTALVDSETDTLLIGGENGLFYRVKLNTKYDQDNNNFTVNPVFTKYRYNSSVKPYSQGIENSTVVYKNLAFFADNGGILQCIDINIMQAVWARDVTDDTDATCVLEEEDQQNVFLYTACEVDKQGPNGFSYIRKYDALNGSPQWEKKYKCYYDSHTNGGALATPVLGKQDISNLVVFNIARYSTPGGGILVALDKYSGEEVWQLALPNYCWSSPVDVYTESGESYIITCDSVGKMYLIKGKTGEILDTISLGTNIEGSPAVYENTIVVGSRGQRIFGIRIK